MKKNKRRNAKAKSKKTGRRNAAGAVALAPRSRSSPRVHRAPPPDLRTLAAAVAASVGSSVASGLLVNQKVVQPETAAMLMAAAGGVGAYFTGGNLRVACTGIAAAGAGQYALAKLGNMATAKAPVPAERAPMPAAPAYADHPHQLAPPVPPLPDPPRQSATGGGIVVDLFRDAAHDLEQRDEDEWRYGMRDADPGDYVELDLDEVA